MYGRWPNDLEKLRNVPGDFAEFGVYQGDRCMEMARDDPKRHIWAWDTFQGMPDDNYIEQLDNSDPPGKWLPAGDIIKKFATSGYYITPVIGKFSDTIPSFEHQDPEHRIRFAFVHVDCDHYWAYHRVLRFIAPRMSPGGVVRLDDYGTCAGAKKATDEWCEESGHKLVDGEMFYF
jgi:O-methyltransferase